MAATDATSPADEFEDETISKWESLRLKTLAEQTYTSDLKSALKYAKRAHRLCPAVDGVSEMLTAFKILSAAQNTAESTASPHWYKILEVEPFSHINSIKKQYKKLALILHPDKNSCVASEEAFKLVNEAFSVLSDRIRRKEYDMELRIAMQTAATAATTTAAEAEEEERDGGEAALETFWTACSSCRLLHQFERKYLGQNLMCPNCKKTFRAVEVDDGNKVNTDEVDDDDDLLTRSDSKRKMSSVGDIMKRSEQSKKINRSKNKNVKKHSKLVNRAEGKGEKQQSVNGGEEETTTLAEMQRRVQDNDEEETMTLAEMQRRGQDDDEEETMTLAEMQRLGQDDDEEETMTLAEMQKLAKLNVNEKDKARKSGAMIRSSNNKTNSEGKNQDLEIMTVEDSDFYDFDEGRMEKSFKKGQIWALYDDDDGMPRHYGLIDEVVSTHPFEVNMSWLDPESNGDDALISLERTGFHISCGRFKVSKKTSVTSLNVFSHVVNCERAAREVYRIYPKKGSVWALYNEHVERGNQLVLDKSRYDIVVFLTSYHEVHGLSMGYLEKVKGYKTIFRRQEIGVRAIKWLEKHEAQLFSHQIPSRKLSREEVPDLSGDCWELDPASLPTQLLTTG